MNCAQIKNGLSGYLDGALGVDERRRVREHLEHCGACSTRARQLAETQELLRSHGRVAPPPDLAFRLQLRLSQETRLSIWQRLSVRFENFLRPIMIPATAGLLATLCTFGVMIQAFMSPHVLADDVPLVALTTPPRLRTSPPITFTTPVEGVWIQTEVDNQGRITDYRVLNAPRDPRELSELRHVLVFTQFEPATFFGRPTAGRTIINFRRISVRG